MDRKDERDDWRVLKLTAPAWTTRVGRIMIQPHGPARMEMLMVLLPALQMQLKVQACWSLDHSQIWAMADQIHADSPGVMSRVFDEVNTDVWCADVELIAGATPAECEVRAREMSSRS